MYACMTARDGETNGERNVACTWEMVTFYHILHSFWRPAETEK